MKDFNKKLFRCKWQLLSVLFAVGFAVVLFQYIEMKKQINGPDSQEILKKLSGHVLLPSVKPEIRPVTDLTLTKEKWPDFYKDAQLGNLIIQYPNTAFLYDPGKNKIINIASSGVFNKPSPAQTLTIALRYNGNESYRALFFKRQVEEDMGNSAYQIIEVSQSNVAYPNDVIYVVNPKKQELVARFAKAIGDSPVLDAPDKNEAPTKADIIVSFKAKQ